MGARVRSQQRAGPGRAWVVRRRWCVKGERGRGGLRRAGGCVPPVAADITIGQRHAAVFAARQDFGIAAPNAGGPPPDDFRQFDTAAWQQAVQANMLIPIELIRASITDMA